MQMLCEDTTSLIDDDTLLMNQPRLPSTAEAMQIVSTQRGKRKLLLDGYIYRLDRSNDRGVEQWRCAKKSCRGRIHLHSSSLSISPGDQSDVTLVSSHSHAAEPAQCEAAIVVDHIRSSAHRNCDESPRDIVDRLLRSVTDETAANLPSVTAMQRSIQRRRQLQKSLDQDIQILWRSIDETSVSPITELSCQQILVLRCDNESSCRQKLANASIWLCTTCHEIKNDSLQCILVIQIFEEENETFLPLIYAFLPIHTKEFYLKIFQELLPLQTPKYILTNCDQILIVSLQNSFHQRAVRPAIKICSAFLQYDLCKTLQQSKQTIDDLEYKSIKCLVALMYIPSADIVMVFEALQQLSVTSIEDVYNKFEDLCIGRLRPNGHRSPALFSATLWNWFEVIPHFDDLFSINTSIKQWNHMFRASLSASSHRSFPKIIRTVQQLYQHQINSKTRKLETNKTSLILQNYYTNKFRQIIRLYRTIPLEEFLLHFIEYLPV